MTKINGAGAHESGERLLEAVSSANIPTLLPVLVQLTGDERWLEAPYLPTPARGMGDHDDAGLPPEVQQEIRGAARAAIADWLDGRPVAIPEPSEALIVRMLSVSMAESIPGEYGPMLREVLGLLPEAEAAIPRTTPPAAPPGFSVVVIGAGVSGIAMGVELQRLGVDYTILEKADAVGGTWWSNRYPGCGVDTPSHLYSYSFYDDYDWPAYFSLRDTLHDYLESAASDLGVRPHIHLRSEVTSARYDEDQQAWNVDVRTADGTVERVRADVVVSAVGAFSRPVWPAIPGLDAFGGDRAHTGDWPEGLDLAGKRVAVVGNGASAMQVMPAIVDDAAHVTVLQRSAQWVVPFEKFHQPVPDPLRRLFHTVPLYRRWYRMRLLWNFNDKLYPSLHVDPEWPHPERSLNRRNDRHREFLTHYIEDELGDRQDLLPTVLPTYPPYGKRILFDNGWFRALRRDDVSLDGTGVAEVRPHSVISGDGTEYEVDVLIAATGFDVVRFLSSVEVIGRAGRSVREIWDGDDAKAYIGTVVPGLPNFFTLYGPNLQPGHGGSFIITVEQQTRYIRMMLEKMFRDGIGSVECRQEVYDDYNAEVEAMHAKLVWSHPGMSTYYRNSRGRIVVNSPWRNVDFFRFFRDPDLDDYDLEAKRTSRHDVA